MPTGGTAITETGTAPAFSKVNVTVAKALGSTLRPVMSVPASGIYAGLGPLAG